jgi:hypothetical protein
MHMNRPSFRSLILGLPALAALSLAAGCSGNSKGDGGGGGSSSGGSGSGGSGSQSGGSSSSAGTNSSSSGSSNQSGSGNSGGSNSGPGGGDFSTSVPGSKPLGDLTPAEVEQLCDDLDAYYSSSGVVSDLEEFSCRLGGLLGAAFAGAETDEAAQAACQSAYDSCMAEPGETTSECSAPSDTCTATVAELAACTNDTREFFRDATQEIPPCNELTLDDLAEGPGSESMAPQSCTTFEMKCPDGPMPPISGM